MKIQWFESRSILAALGVLFVSATAFAGRSTLTFDGTISNTNLGWENVTLEDLYSRVYTSGDTTADYLTIAADGVTIHDIAANHANVTLVVDENGKVQASAYPGIVGLTATPAVARIEERIEGGAGGANVTFKGTITNTGFVDLGWTGVTVDELLNYTWRSGEIVGTQVQVYGGSLNVNFGGVWITIGCPGGVFKASSSTSSFEADIVGVPPGGSESVATIKARNYTSFAEALVAAKGTEKVLVLDASAIPSGTEVTEDSDGAYLTVKAGYKVDAEGNVVAEEKLYYVSGATEWTSDLKVASSKDGEATIATKAGDIVTFDKGGEFGPIYIHAKPAEKVPVAGFEVLSGTLKVGYEGSFASIPEGWIVTVAEGAAVQFDNWAPGWPVKVMDATFNGEGAIRFGSTITSSSVVTFGTIKGDATIAINDGLTVTATSIANPVVLEGGATLKSKNPIVDISAANGDLISETEDAEGNHVYTVKRVVYWTNGNEWSTKGAGLVPTFKHGGVDGETATYQNGDVVFIDGAVYNANNASLAGGGNRIWIGSPADGVAFVISGGEIHLQNTDSSRTAFKNSEVTVKNAAKLYYWDQWNGLTLVDAVIHVEEGSVFGRLNGNAVVPTISGTVRVDGLGTIDFGNGIRFADANSKLVVPETTATISVLSEIPDGYKLVTTTANGMTTYAVKEYKAKVAYYKSGYIGNESSLTLTETSGGAAAAYEEAPEWTLVIDANSPANAWAAKSYKYAGNDINVTKFVIEKNFTLKNGANQDGIFDGITFEIASGATLTLADSAANQKMTLGAANFTGAGSVDISGVSTWTTITAAEGQEVIYASGLKVKTETTDGATTYTVSAAPTSWDEIDETTTLAEIVPAAQAEVLAKHDVTASQIRDWAKMYGVSFDSANGINLECFALNTSEQWLKDTKGSFKMTFSFDEDGNPVADIPSYLYNWYNIRPVIMGSTDLKEWHEKKAGDTFFKAVIDL